MRILSAFPGVAFAPRCEGSRLATIRREAAHSPTVGSGRPIGAPACCCELFSSWVRISGL